MPARQTTSRSSSEGFTLVEMLMAMLVMTVGLLGLLQSVQSAYRQVVTDRVREEAVVLAEERMHDWRREAFAEIAKVEHEVSTATKVIGGVEREFEVVKEVEKAGAAARPALKMRVSVSWTIRGIRCSHDIFTLRTEEELE